MDRFSKTLHGYDPEEVNQYLDDVIEKVENLIDELKAQDSHIKELEEKLARYEGLENTLRDAVIMATKTSEQMKLNTLKESELIINDAKKNANRIVNDALIKADMTEREAAMLKRNINIFKRKLKEQLETQLELVDDIEKVDF